MKYPLRLKRLVKKGKFGASFPGSLVNHFSHSSGPGSLNKKKILRPVTDDFKTVVQVFADFLQYLFKHAKEYIIESERKINSTFTWSAIEKNTYFVLTHPNGWEGNQQSQMREAAVAAGLADSSTAANRIIFVTEGEASLHFCLDKNPKLHQERGGLLVVDCGGGTINLSAYSQTGKGGFEEIVSPDCLLQGSIFVTSRARDYFKRRFKGSNFGSDAGVEAMARAFDKPEGTKCIFDHPNKPYFVKFGGLRDKDSNYDIYGGRFKVEGAKMAEFFEPAVKDIIDRIIKQCRNTKDGVSIKYVLLVGGFGRSQYLYAKLSDYFKPRDIVVLRPDITQQNKAVADGAISWYLCRYVSARIAKYSYGVSVEQEFDPTNPEHVSRESTKLTCANGKFCIPGGFLTIMKRVCFALFCFLSCYRCQSGDSPKWIDLEPNSFHDLCAIGADLIDMKMNMKPQNSGSKQFYELNLDLVILFGSTELEAYVAWKEDVSICHFHQAWQSR
ncbi:hypothetical protein M378DRAFT_92351 [Amanita muscaria Koide BX008]|uniref:Uncharacterized protein n=1 Tax=Amanita muscaria (strain Koide BX008) TaxID=946122 RepID=A0A0C2WEP3_AMAMK|nr:hypothetical protein M378DRAFT_92351 [Amanita muscaria Koide BX008]